MMRGGAVLRESAAVTTSVDALLLSVRRLPRPQQAQQVVAWAREGAAADDFGALVVALSRSGGDGRRLALIAAGVGRCTDYLTAALHDYHPEWWLRVLRCSRPVDDQVVARAVLAAPPKLRHQAYKAMWADGRPGVADALIDAVRARWGTAEAVALLPVCGPSTVARLLPELADLVDDWRGLFARHPEAALEHVEARLVRHGGFAGAFSVDQLVEATDTLRLDRVVRLVERYGPRRELPCWGSRLDRLSRTDPARASQLLVRELAWAESTPTRALRRVLGRDESVLSGIIEAIREDMDNDAAADYRMPRLFGQLPLALREQVLDTVTAGEELAGRLFSADLLETLPRGRRQREVRRMLALPAVRADRDRTRSLAAFLPLAEAAAILVPATELPDGADRARAYGLLVACAVRNGVAPPVLREIGRLDRLRTEEDPAVLLGVVGVLGRTPPRWGSLGLLTALFGDGLIPVLDRIAADAYAHRNDHHVPDVYWPDPAATIRQLDVLVASLLTQLDACPPALAEWLVRTAAWMAKRWGHRGVGRLDRALLGPLPRRLLDVLRPSLADPALACALGLTLRRKARSLPELIRLLQHTPTAPPAPQRWAASSCIALDCLGTRCDLVPSSWQHPDQP